MPSVWNKLLSQEIESLHDSKRLQRGTGVDGEKLELYATPNSKHLERLKRELTNGIYKPRPTLLKLHVKEQNSKPRATYSPASRDYLVSRVIAAAAQRDLNTAPSPPKKTLLALSKALRKHGTGKEPTFSWIVRLDIKAFFDSIPGNKLVEELRKSALDNAFVSAIELLGQSKIHGTTETIGRSNGINATPQGYPHSHVLANWYLRDLPQEKFNCYIFRYVDDILILVPSAAKPLTGFFIYLWVKLFLNKRSLKTHPLQLARKSQISHITGNSPHTVTFLGYAIVFDEDGHGRLLLPETVIKREKTKIWRLFNQFLGTNPSSKISHSADPVKLLQYRIYLRSVGCKYKGRIMGFGNYWSYTHDPGQFKILDRYVAKLCKQFGVTKTGSTQAIKSFYYRTYHFLATNPRRASLWIDFDSLTAGEKKDILTRDFGIRQSLLNGITSDQLDAIWHQTLRAATGDLEQTGFY